MSDPQKKRQRFNEGPVSPREAARRKAQLEDYEGLPVDLIKLYDNFTFLGRGSFGFVKHFCAIFFENRFFFIGLFYFFKW